jgi:phenylpropionate dioxygenase-like ring-hydroxylating dioxygenase large terminal subunit
MVPNDKPPPEYKGPIEFFGVDQQYFIAAVLPQVDQREGRCVLFATPTERAVTASFPLSLGPGQAATRSFTVYFRHAYNGNWKLYLENLCDAAHPWFTHRSSIDAAQQQKDDVYSDGMGEIAIRQMRQNGAPYAFWESQVGIWTYPNGHSFLGDYHDDSKLVAAMNDPMFREYIASLESQKGRQEARRILQVRRWNSNVYPNLSFMSQFQQLRVVHPIAVDRTIVCTYSFRLCGAPAKMFKNTIAFANVVNGTGSLVLTDDLEIYNRIGLGISSEGAEWIQIGRGYQSDVPDEHRGKRGKNSTSEVYIRNMFDAWRQYMVPGAQPASSQGAGS